jgi:hypothetical protein
MITNFSKEELVVTKSTVLGIAEGVMEDIVDRINADNKSKRSSSNDQQGRKRNDALYRQLLRGKLNHLPEEDRRLIEAVLRKFAHVFQDDQSNDYKGTDAAEHQIQLEDAHPIETPVTRTFRPEKGNENSGR